MVKDKKIRCPACSGESEWEGNRYRPFCSERCSLIDLGQWADGRYSMGGENGNDVLNTYPVMDEQANEEEG